MKRAFCLLLALAALCSFSGCLRRAGVHSIRFYNGVRQAPQTDAGDNNRNPAPKEAAAGQMTGQDGTVYSVERSAGGMVAAGREESAVESVEGVGVGVGKIVIHAVLGGVGTAGNGQGEVGAASER